MFSFLFHIQPSLFQAYFFHWWSCPRILNIPFSVPPFLLRLHFHTADTLHSICTYWCVIDSSLFHFLDIRICTFILESAQKVLNGIHSFLECFFLLFVFLQKLVYLFIALYFFLHLLLVCIDLFFYEIVKTPKQRE